MNATFTWLITSNFFSKKFFFGILFLLINTTVHGQLFYWDTSGLNGSEASRQSAYNDPNLDPGILTKGAGVTTAFNTNRFGGKGWPNTLSAAVAGNNYIELIVSPVAGYVFSASSFFFIWEFDAGGPNTITLRSSKDGFVSNIGTRSVSSGGTVTISISGHDTLPATKFRLYGYGGTSATAGGGFDCVASSANVSFEGTTETTPLPPCLNAILYPLNYHVSAYNEVDTVTTCAFSGFYYKFFTPAGRSYRFTSSGGADNYLTLRMGTVNGPVAARGFSTVSGYAFADDTMFIHLTKDPYCNNDFDCRILTAECSSCPPTPPDPCDNITPIGCDVEETVSYSGSGLYDLTHCPNGASIGKEKIFSFTPAVTGMYSLIWTITQQVPHVQYFIKPQASGCGSGGWICLGNFISGPVLQIGTLIAGTPYYLLCDAGATFSFDEAFKLHCPLNCITNCSADITTVNDPDQCGAIVNYPAAVVTGGTCSITGSTPSSGSFFPIGITKVTTTYDAPLVCVFNITVNDNQVPVIQSPANISIINNIPGTCIGKSAITDPMSDNCSGGKWNATFTGNPNGNPANTGDIPDGTNSPVITFQAGSTTVTLNATDSSGNNAVPATYTVYVSDVEAPLLNIAVGISILSASPGLCTANYTIASPLIDNCPGGGTWYATFSGNPNGNPPATAVFPEGLSSDNIIFEKGTTTVTLHGSDATGNVAPAADFFVEVKDYELPTFVCPGEQTLNTTGSCSQTYTIENPVRDNCSGANWNATFSGNANGNPASTGDISDETNSLPIIFQKGTTTVTLNATDASGNNAVACSFNVIVRDADPPIVNCPAHITVDNEPNQCGAHVSFNIIAFDNCTGLTIEADHASGGFFPVGVTTVNTSATDASGNVSFCVFNIKVNDTQPPVLTCPANITKCGSQVINYSTPTATDNCSGVTVTPASGNISSGSVFPVGITTLSFTATDASGNTVTCSFTVTVNPSVIGVILSNTASFNFCKGSSIVLDAGNYASYQWSIGATSRTIATNSAGTYTVTVTDAKGCTGSASVTTTRVTSSPSQPNAISGQVNGLCNTTGNVFSIAPVSNAESYVWNVTNGIITGGQGTNSITVNFSGFSSSTVAVKARNSCGLSNSRNLNVIGKPLAPVVINGSKNGVCSKSGIPYSVSDVLGATYYRWNVPSHVSIVSGQGTKDLVVNFSRSFSSGSISCKAENSCGNSSSTSLNVSSKPQKPAVISGPTGVCRHQSGFIYSTPSVYGAVDYIWKVPSGATIQSGQGTPTISVRFGNNSGKIEVYAKNNCGKTETRDVKVSFTCREEENDLLVDHPNNKINIYPNPAHEKVTVDIDFRENMNCKFRMMDLSGRIVISENHDVISGINSFDLNVSTLAEGVYMLIVESANETFKRKIVVE